MNDRELLTAVKESFGGVRAETPVEQIERRGHAIRMRRRGLAGAATTVVAAAAAIGVAVSTGPAARPVSPPQQLAAWTVTQKPHDIIEVQLRELKDPAGLQHTLRADGVPAFIRFINQNPPGCLEDQIPQYFDIMRRILPEPTNADLAQGSVLDINRAAIPRGVGIWLAVSTPQVHGSGPSGYVSFGWSTTLVYASGHCPGK